MWLPQGRADPERYHHFGLWRLRTDPFITKTTDIGDAWQLVSARYKETIFLKPAPCYLTMIAPGHLGQEDDIASCFDLLLYQIKIVAIESLDRATENFFTELTKECAAQNQCLAGKYLKRFRILRLPAVSV